MFSVRAEGSRPPTRSPLPFPHCCYSTDLSAQANTVVLLSCLALLVLVSIIFRAWADASRVESRSDKDGSTRDER
jgi:hypothetical protein